jgi:hypothetical protein
MGAFSLEGQDLQSVTRLRWTDPLDRLPDGYADYAASRDFSIPPRVRLLTGSEVISPFIPGNISSKVNDSRDGHEEEYPPRHMTARLNGTGATEEMSGWGAGIPDAGEKVLVIVEENLSFEILSVLQQFSDDLTGEGYIPVIESWSGGTADSLRDHIVAIYDLGKLDGVLMIGDLPIAWFEDSYWGYEEFPIDYYFMELDGTWSDNDSDGMFENLSGDEGPEIWVGRLYASQLTWGGEIEIIRNYFEKNHAYRTGAISLPHRGLAFVDDDWSYWGDCYLDYAYSDVATITSYNQTTASNYKSNISDSYEWVHLCAHSCPWAHTFMINGGYPGGGSVMNCEVHALMPPAFFYNLFNCSGTRYTETDNIGTWYALMSNYGLAAVGSSKTGSMLYFDEFYRPLGSGESIGDAYQDWFDEQARYGFSGDERAWYFGLNILGDPTVTIFMEDVSGESGNRDPSPKFIEYPLPFGGEWEVDCVSDDQFSDGRPVATVDSDGGIWAFWESGRNVRLDIYGSYYDGNSWTQPSAVNSHTYWDAHPAACTDSLGRAWVFWQSFMRDYYTYRQEIYSSYRSGSNWSSARRVSLSKPGYQTEPAAATDADGTVWCVWKGWENLHADILAAYWNGSSWTGQAIISESGSDNLDPAITSFPGGGVTACWSSNATGDWEIMFSTNTGSGWTAPQPVSVIEGADINPTAVSTPGGIACAAWQSWTEEGADILASFNEGTGWSAPQVVAGSLNDEVSPSLCAGDDGIWCAWMVRSSNEWRIMASCNRGHGWSTPEAVVTDHVHCYHPALALKDGIPFCLWASDHDGPWNIYRGKRITVPNVVDELPVCSRP